MTQEQYDEALKKNNEPSSTLQSQQRLESVTKGGISLAEAQLLLSRKDVPAAPASVVEAPKPAQSAPTFPTSTPSAEANMSRPSVGKVKR